MQKTTNLLNMWKQRNLTIKGRVTVIKSLVFPIVLFIAAFLFVPKKYIKELDTLFYNFVWPGGKHHVKQNVMIQSLENGGIKMPDLLCYTEALQMMWIKRILSKNNSYATTKYILKTDELNIFFQYKNNIKFLHPMPPFYENALRTWFLLHNKSPINSAEIRGEYLWNNENILIENKPAKSIKLHKKGINHIVDIVNNDGSFKSVEHLSNTFNTNVDAYYYHCLKSAIPTQWLQVLRGTPMTNIDNTVNINVMIGENYISIKKLYNKDIYNELIEHKLVRPVCYFKWESVYFYANLDWSLINLIPYCSTRETALQSLQFQIIHRYFPTKYILHLWGKEEDPYCQLCGDIDTLEHYFCECNTTRDFWTNLKIWVQNEFTFCINFGKLDILFGLPNELNSPELKLFNLIILLGKYHIKKCKQQERSPLVGPFIHLFNQRVSIEKYLCQLENKEESFDILRDYYERIG